MRSRGVSMMCVCVYKATYLRVVVSCAHFISSMLLVITCQMKINKLIHFKLSEHINKYANA